MTDRSRAPVVAVTMGDPAGIGPEVALRALSSAPVRRALRPLLIGDAGVFSETARRLGVRLSTPVVEVSSLRATERRPGRPTVGGAEAAYRAILEAVKRVRDGEAAAVVTAPVSKAAIREAGHDFLGHTELIARLAGGADVRMMMSGATLRVVLVTTHIPYTDVPKALSVRRVARTAEIASTALRRYFGIRRPRLALAGLNPHAGERGAMGREEVRVLEPAIQAARRRGVVLVGPIPADTVFFRAREGEFDAVISLYHDQGLAPFKVVHFRDGVNVTLGLPFPRTSPDHGTAFDISGRRPADPTSMAAALRLAAAMNGRRSR